MVQADIPGVSKSAINIDVEDNTLSHVCLATFDGLAM